VHTGCDTRQVAVGTALPEAFCTCGITFVVVNTGKRCTFAAGAMPNRNSQDYTDPQDYCDDSESDSEAEDKFEGIAPQANSQSDDDENTDSMSYESEEEGLLDEDAVEKIAKNVHDQMKDKAQAKYPRDDHADLDLWKKELKPYPWPLTDQKARQRVMNHTHLNDNQSKELNNQKARHAPQ